MVVTRRMPVAASRRYQRPAARQSSATAVSGVTSRRYRETGVSAAAREQVMLAPDWSERRRRAAERGREVNSTWGRGACGE